MPFSPESSRIRQAILDLLKARDPGKTICPSEAARKLYPADQWRAQMPLVRAEAVQLTLTGQIEITQRGVPVDPHQFRGPIRLRLRQA